ncbi:MULTISPECIES: hypothetical protein [Bhargavaea]|uniref:Uncharacterized protein n=1 Tax=Bhargavaea changchunensis TaxID=2134037 RepID=A0ABW2NBP0_9BACL|nr:hypothetical protein [Bhargavaea sp. CC-171006]
MSRTKWVLMHRTEWIDGQKQKVWVYEPAVPAEVGRKKQKGWRVEAWQRQGR